MECPPFKFPSAQSAQYKSCIYSLLTCSVRDPWPVETAKKEVARTKPSSDSISCKLTEWVDLLHIDQLDPFCGGFIVISCWCIVKEGIAIDLAFFIPI